MDQPVRAILSNGLRVILLEKRDAPVVSWNLWANVGSVNETDENAGICHLIEHMIFKGTGRRPVGQIAKEVEAAGGDMNAYTSFDETVFYINMSARKMDVGLDVLADAAADPTFDETELTREKEVVVEEISRAEDNPSQMVSEDLFTKAYTVHPYRRPIAGDRKTVRGISRQTLLEFYRKWYVGSNLIFVGVGDFDSHQLVKKIESLFSTIPGGNPPSQTIPAEPPQRGARFTSRGMTVMGCYLDLALPIPHFTHEDTPALDTLSQILGGGASSRLEQRLREKMQVVTQISASSYTPRYPGLLVAGAVLKDAQPLPAVEAIWEEMRRLKDEKVASVELARAKENIRSSRIYEKQTAQGLARKLGFFEGIAGRLEYEEEYYLRIAGLTAEKLQEVAQRYFYPERITLSVCHPKEKSFEGLGERLSRFPQKATPVTKKPKTPIHRFLLPHGIRLLVRENRSLPLVAIRTAILGGLRAEERKLNGISHLISLLITKGTLTRTAREIAEEQENMAGHFDAFCGWNLVGVSGLFLSEKLTEGIGLFSDLLMNPSFPEEEIVKEKEATLTAIRNQEDQLQTVVMKNFLAGLYGKHPYGMPLLGSAGTVKGLKRPQIVRYLQATTSPRNIVIAASGDLDPVELKTRIEEKLKGWRTTGRHRRPPRFQPLGRPVETEEMRKEKFQAHLVFGFPGTTIRDRDRFPLEVLNAVLAGQGGRLFLELRDKQGLCYAISSSSQEGIEPGYFLVYMGCDPAKLETALAGVRRELEKVTQEMVSEEEIDRAKRYLIGNYELELQKNSSVAAILASDEIYGLGWKELFRYPEEIDRVSRDAILRVAKKYLRPERSVLSVVRP